jgi:hypothetical protein
MKYVQYEERTRSGFHNFARVVSDESLFETSCVHVLAENLDSGSSGLGSPSRSNGLDLRIDELEILFRLAAEIGHFDDDRSLTWFLKD